MSLKETLNADIKTAMRAGEKDRLLILRMVSAAIKQREIDERKDLGEDEVLAVIEKMVKQRRESEKLFREGDRNDLADKEAAEIVLISHYLPEPLSQAELEALVDASIAETGASSVKDMGRVMGKIKGAAQGRADMSQVGALVKARLG